MKAGKSSSHCLLCLDGEAGLNAGGKTYRIGKGETVFLPAGLGAYAISGQADLLLTYLE